MSKPTLPIELGKRYVRRDGKIVTASTALGMGQRFVDVGLPGERERGVDVFVYRDTGWVLPASTCDLVADYIEPTSHPHAALMALYAQDAAETAEPWTRWQWRNPLVHEPRWSDCKNDFMFSSACEYRRKPETARIGEFDVPMPMTEAPEVGAEIWVIPMLSVEGAWRGIWTGQGSQPRWLRNGLIHTTREAAELHARALLSFTEAKA